MLCYHSQLFPNPCWDRNYWAITFPSSGQRKLDQQVFRRQTWHQKAALCWRQAARGGEKPMWEGEAGDGNIYLYIKQLFSCKYDEPTAICDRRCGPTVVGRCERKIVRSRLASLTQQQSILEWNRLAGSSQRCQQEWYMSQWKLDVRALPGVRKLSGFSDSRRSLPSTLRFFRQK